MGKKSLYAICEDLYEGAHGVGGQSAVLDYIEKNHPEVKWAICEPCECLSPVDNKEPICLVCGSTIEPEHMAKAVGQEDFYKAEEWVG